MKVSFFKEDYTIINANIKFKKDLSNNIYAVEIDHNRMKSRFPITWSVESFRPDITSIPENSKVKVYYENVNCLTNDTCYKFPRYVLSKSEGWFINIR